MTCTIWKSCACNPINLMKWILLLTLFFRWGNSGMESILAISYGSVTKYLKHVALKQKEVISHRIMLEARGPKSVV